MPIETRILVTGAPKGNKEVKKFAKTASKDINQLEKNSVASSKKMSAAFKGIGAGLGTLGIAFGVGIAAKGLQSLVKAGSDVEESLNKVREVFGSASGAVERFSQKAAESIGASRQEALAMTGEVGNLLVAFGFADDKAGKFSTQMVQLAADLGSFNNVPTVDALNAIRSALVGESEPIRRFGADVRQARLDQIALAEGLEFTKGKMDSQTKAIAAMKAIMLDTAKAQGDFARTSEGLANSSKIMEANLKDLAAALGTELIPVAKIAVKSLTLIAKGIKDVIDGFSSGETLNIAKSFGIKEWIAATVLAIDGTNEWAFQTVVASEKAREAIKKASDELAKTGKKPTGKGSKLEDDPVLKRELALRQEILASLKLQADKQRVLNQLRLEGLVPLETRAVKAGKVKEIEDEALKNKIQANTQEMQTVGLKKLQIKESEALLTADLLVRDTVFSISDGIGQAIIQGRELTKVFQNIASQILSTGISGLIFGGFSALTGGGFGAGFRKFFGFADGGRPITGRPNIVGENNSKQKHHKSHGWK
jgi:hypothetical protein